MNLTHLLKVFIIFTSPIAELRLALLLGLNFRTAFTCIALGVFIAGIAVTAFSLLAGSVG